MYANIAHLLKKSSQNRSKIDFLNEVSDNCLLIGLTETHLSADIKDCEVTINKFSIIRCDRLLRSGGGVCLYINSDVSFKKCVSYSNSVCELLIVEILKPNLFVIVLYRPPDCQLNEFKDTIDVVDQWLKGLKAPLPNIILMGDFNLPNYDWTNMPLTTNSLHVSSLLDITNLMFINQLICEPTRKSNILDLVFSSLDIIKSITIQNTALSDHNLITAETNIPISQNSTKSVKNPAKNGFELLNFHKADWSVITTSLDQQSWSSILADSNSVECFDLIHNKLLATCSHAVPIKSNTKKHKNSFCKSRRKHLRRRKRIHIRLETKRVTASQLAKLNTELTTIEKTLLASHESERKFDELNAIKQIKSDPKYFFRYASKQNNLMKSIGPLVNAANELTSEPKEMCQLLQNQYLKAFSMPSQSDIIHDVRSFFMSNNSPAPVLDTVKIDPSDVMTAIKEMPNHSAAGPDGIPSMLLKNCAKELSEPLSIFFQKSIDEGVMPPIFKSAAVVPIHKGGDKNLPSNYRPISLTPIITKVFERIVRKAMVAYLEDNDLMNSTQHGFRKGRSCISALIDVYDYIMQSLGDSEVHCVDMIYLDFAKAFDKVDHHILLRKLKSLGITGSLGIWLSDFLSSRSQFVQIPGGVSDTGPVSSGVPQGTVLGPVLFLILISDINSDIKHCKISSFADDTRLYSAISNPYDCDKLQVDLNSVYKWAERNNMQFNSDKFKYLCFHTKQSMNTENVYISPTHSIINPSNSVKDLGVLMSSNSSFEIQIDKAVKTCSQLVGWILRTFSTRDRITMLTLFKSLVLPRIEYGSQLWSPYLLCQINSVERVQRLYTKYIENMYDLSYEDRLKSLNLYSLQRRRDRYMIIYIWKIIENQASNFNPPIQINSSERLGRQCIKSPVPPGHHGTLMFNSFRWQATRLFNSLPKSIRNVTHVSSSVFKNILDLFLTNVKDNPCGSFEDNSIYKRMAEIESRPLLLWRRASTVDLADE